MENLATQIKADTTVKQLSILITSLIHIPHVRLGELPPTCVLLLRYVYPTRLYSTLNWNTPYTSGSLKRAIKTPSGKRQKQCESLQCHCHLYCGPLPVFPTIIKLYNLHKLLKNIITIFHGILLTINPSTPRSYQP